MILKWSEIHVVILCIVSTCVYICILMHISIHIFHFSLPIFLFSQPLIDFWIIHTCINKNRCELLLEIQRWHASVIMASSAAIGYAPWLIRHYFIIKIYPSNCLSYTQYTNKSIERKKVCILIDIDKIESNYVQGLFTVSHKGHHATRLVWVGGHSGLYQGQVVSSVRLLSQLH